MVVDTDAMPEMVVHIVQPLKEHYDSWSIDWTTLCTHILGDIADAVRRNKQKNPVANPSREACIFCDSRSCQARFGVIYNARDVVVAAAADPHAVSKEKWKEILDAAEDLEGAIKTARSYANGEIKAGRGFPGYKHVTGRSKRFFKDASAGEAFIVERLGKKAYKTTTPPVITLAQAEKVDPKLKNDEKWTSMIEKVSGKPALVPEDDPRDAVFYGKADFSAEAVEMQEIKEPDF